MLVTQKNEYGQFEDVDERWKEEETIGMSRTHLFSLVKRVNT